MLTKLYQGEEVVMEFDLPNPPPRILIDQNEVAYLLEQRRDDDKSVLYNRYVAEPNYARLRKPSSPWTEAAVVVGVGIGLVILLAFILQSMANG